ncbi:MAG TPA: hypothetical protein DDZ81_13070 [Acetobacteraceae bacterium]|jgi:hypothetical protein|nr:hypothetical protein [Acetobacteraceae bacterium]
MPPEIRLARRLIERRGLLPPVDVENILREYAHVEFVDFPVPIDGLCLNLKALGQKPTVLVSKRIPPFRRRFTLAHELGHVLIPWHLGSIIDEIDGANGDVDNFQLEAEANRFASELLMPSDWVKEQIILAENPLDALFLVHDVASVSLQAASIKFADCLAPNYVIASSSGGTVDWSARSRGTLAGTVRRGTDLNLANPFPFPCDRWSRVFQGISYDLWYFGKLENFETDGVEGPWRRILDQIVGEIISDEIGQKKFKLSVNGVTSNANGMVRSERRLEAVISAMRQRLYASATSDKRYGDLVNHTKFRDFCVARASDYIARRSRQ